MGVEHISDAGGSSYTKRIEADGSRIYELAVPCADGREAFYRLSIDRLKEHAFQKAFKEGLTVELTDYGTILESYYLSTNVFLPVISTVN